MKLIVTGERDWTDRDAVYRAIVRALATGRGGPHVIVHGDCPTGADRFADDWCASQGVKVVRFTVDPALDSDWPGAGPRRNRRMISAHLDAHGGLAFWSGKRDKSGTLDAMAYMTECGIPVRIVPRAKRTLAPKAREGE